MTIQDLQEQGVNQYAAGPTSAAGAQLERFVARSRGLDLTGIAWHRVAEYPLSPEALRALLYLQDIESHTVVFPRTTFSARTVNDEIIGPFLTCWLYEEGFHGRALAQFLAAAGHAIPSRPQGRLTPADRVYGIATAALSAVWPDFLTLYMTWGALNELTALTTYQRFSELADHPILTELVSRIIRDEVRHFTFYYGQAKERLQRPTAARLTRFLIDHCWAPVGSDVQPGSEVRFIASYLFSGTAGRSAAHKVDKTIQRLPGFAGASLLEAWIDREVGCWSK